jgi:hypothetical protein
VSGALSVRVVVENRASTASVVHELTNSKKYNCEDQQGGESVASGEKTCLLFSNGL